MEKKELKWYEAPQVEVVEMKMLGHLLQGSGGITTTPGGSIEEPEGSM